MSEAFFKRMLSGVDFCTELFARRASRTVSGTIAMANSGEPFLQLLNPGAGAVLLNLPLETANDGKLLLVANVTAGAGTVALQSNAGAALSPAVSVAAGASVLAFCDGTVWRAFT